MQTGATCERKVCLKVSNGQSDAVNRSLQAIQRPK